MIEEIVLANLGKSQRWSGLHKTEIASLISEFHVITGSYKEIDSPTPDVYYIVPIMASTPVTPHDLINEARNVCDNVGKTETGYNIVIGVIEVDSSITYLKIKEGINKTI